MGQRHGSLDYRAVGPKSGRSWSGVGHPPQHWRARVGEIAFQEENHVAARFWRSVADECFGPDWVEEIEAVPDKPHVPPDHWIRSQ